MKVCNKCNVNKPASDFFRKSKTKDGLQNSCKECASKYGKSWYLKNTKRHKRNTRENRIKQASINKEFILNYLQGKSCKDCGYNKSIIPLEFDHLQNKRNEVSVMISNGYSLEAIQEEINKCEIVCANCHRIRTELRRNSYRAGSHSGRAPDLLLILEG